VKPWRVFGIATLAVLLTGCATSALWREDRFARMHEPAVPVNLRLFESTRNLDLLVLYDEWLDSGEARKSRAYWLQPDQEPVRNPHRPDFVSPSRAKGLTPLPIYDLPPGNLSTHTNLFAVTVSDPPGFDLYSGDRKVGVYELPIYGDAHGRTMQVLLTPGAVTVDAVLIGTCLGLIYWAGGGDFGLH
jgi:hypothetical protein